VSKDLPLTPEDVADIAAILDGTSYQTLDVKTSRFRLRVARQGKEGAGGWTQEWDFSDNAPDAVKAIAAEAVAPEDASAIRAPLPGTFYRAPQPGAPPFVEIGSVVDADTVIGIIETMKLMNPVHAGAIGTISEILADNGAMVDKRAALMRIA
jgi:acetyl-CoA carboxylase biotin carboxyl carrier protein